MIYNTKNDHLREQPGQMMLENDYASSPVKASTDALVEPTDKKRQYQEELAIQKENLMRKTEQMNKDMNNFFHKTSNTINKTFKVPENDDDDESPD